MKKISPEDQRQPDQKLNLGLYWRVFWRRKHYIAIPVVVAIFVSAVGVRFLTPMYGSSTVIRVEDRNLLSREVARFVQLEERRRMHDSEMLGRMRAEILSSSFLDQLIRTLGMDSNQEIRRKILAGQRQGLGAISPDELIFRRLRGYLGSKISVQGAGPSMFRISFFDYNPEVCYVIANALTNQFIESQQIQRMRALQDASEFSDEQLAVYKERLEDSESELEEVRKELAEKKLGTNPVEAINVKYAELLLQRIGITVADKEAVVEKIKQNLKAAFGAVPSNDEILRDADMMILESNLAARRDADLMLELSSSGKISTELTESRSSISQIQIDLQHRLATLVQEVYPSIDADYRSLVVEYFYQLSELKSYKEELATLRYYIDKYHENRKLIPLMEQRIEKLKETVEANRTLYNTFLGAKTAAQIGEAAQDTELGTRIEIVEQARKPVAPVKPNKLKILLVSLLFSGILGVSGLVIGELSDTSLETVEDVEAVLGFRVLGTIPRFETDVKWKRGNPRRRAAAWIAASLFVIVISIFGFYYYGKFVQTQFFTETSTEALKRPGSSSGG